MFCRDLQDIPGDRGCISPGWGPRPPVVSEKFCLGFCKAAVSTFTFAPQASVSLYFRVSIAVNLENTENHQITQLTV